MQILNEWWFWVAGGFVLAALEILIPGYVLLGLAVGAVLTGGLVWLGVLGASLSFMVLVWALVSLVAWTVLRRAFGMARDQVKIVRHDINEN